jgi:pilus assembly protein Flp/PilA
MDGVDSHQSSGGGNQKHHHQDRHWQQPYGVQVLTIKVRRSKMKTYLQNIVGFINDEEGASAIEYGLLVGLIALAITVGAGLLGTSINGMFTRSATRLDAVAP